MLKEEITAMLPKLLRKSKEKIHLGSFSKVNIILLLKVSKLIKEKTHTETNVPHEHRLKNSNLNSNKQVLTRNPIGLVNILSNQYSPW